MKKIVIDLRKLMCLYNVKEKITSELKNYLVKNFLVRKYNGVTFDCKVYSNSPIKIEFNRSNAYVPNSKAFKLNTSTDYHYLLSLASQKDEQREIYDRNKIVIVQYPDALFVAKMIQTKKKFYQYIREIENNINIPNNHKMVYCFYVTPPFLFANESFVRLELSKFYLSDFSNDKAKRDFNEYYSLVNENILKPKKNFNRFIKLPSKVEDNFQQLRQNEDLHYLLYTNNLIRNNEVLNDFYRNLKDYYNLLTNDKEIEKTYQGARKKFRILSKRHTETNLILQNYLDIQIYLTKDLNALKSHILNYITFLEQFYI